MSEPMSYNLEAIKADGFVDFYELVGLPSSSSTEELRTRIQALYSDAQANRDHRNLNKRRDYQSLLEYLPQARTALLDDDKRARYDDYRAQVTSGVAPTPFANFMGELTGQAVDQDRTDVLGVTDGGRASSPTSPSSSKSGSARSTSGSGASSRRQPQVPSSTQAGLNASAMSVIVFAILTLIIGFAMGNWPTGILIGAVAAVIVWFIARPRGGTRVGR
jgi:cobalamin biosynthesis Mg chelatase CobN